MPGYDRLSAQDVTFLYAESNVAHMHVGSLVIFEDPGLTEEKIHEHIGSRLHLAPRFRRKLMWVPYDQGRPVWVDDPDFDLRFHIRYTGLPKPGGMDEARRLMGRVMSIPLDRTRPLWELWLFDLPDGRKGMIHKTHHCLIDGMSGIDLATVLLDFEPNPAPREPPPPWAPDPPPQSWELLRDSLVERLTSPGEMVRAVQEAAGQGRKLWDRAAEVAEGVLAFGKASMETAPRTSLNTPIGAHRRFEVARVPLERVKEIKNRFGCKVNDVVLAAVAGGLRSILDSRGDPVDDLVLKVLVPVSVRDQSQRMTYGNLVSGMTADLPVGEAEPAARLERLRDHMAGLKESKQTVGIDFFLRAADYAPPTIVALASRTLVQNQRMVNLAVTNVPGPQFPLYLAGGKMIEAFPFVPLVGTLAVGVAVLSYDGQLNFGVSGDWDVVPDLALVSEGIEQAIEELASSPVG